VSAEGHEAEAHADAAALLTALLDALGRAEPAEAAALAWPLLGRRPAGEVGDEAGFARLLANERHRPLLGTSRREVLAWDVREGAARAELRVTPEDGSAPHGWLVSLARGADGRWLVSGLQREGFEASRARSASTSATCTTISTPWRRPRWSTMSTRRRCPPARAPAGT
jgi:hypothetical protein